MMTHQRDIITRKRETSSILLCECATMHCLLYQCARKVREKRRKDTTHEQHSKNALYLTMMVVQANDDGDAQQQSPPTIVEDIPSHEIYASLLGIKRKPALATASVISNNSSSSGVMVVETDTSIPPAPTPSAFGRAFAKSQELPPLSNLLLDNSNKGFQLLQKMGWEERDGGLGRNRQGSLLPVTTVRLEDNRKGVGAQQQRKTKPRITHYPPAPKTTECPESKGQRKRRLRAEREQDSRDAKRIRMMLRTDVADEYEQLYTSLYH
jgi:hypothetical protein